MKARPKVLPIKRLSIRRDLYRPIRDSLERGRTEQDITNKVIGLGHNLKVKGIRAVTGIDDGVGEGVGGGNFYGATAEGVLERSRDVSPEPHEFIRGDILPG